MSLIPRQLERFFWDVDFTAIDTERNKDYIITKILEYGDFDALKWLFGNFVSDDIQQVLIERRGFSQKTANFWRVFFNLPEDRITCLNKFYQKQPELVWPY